jgi:site-specific recombinase XerD
VRKIANSLKVEIQPTSVKRVFLNAFFSGTELSRTKRKRHTYSTLLNEYGTDVKVQQELLRHADIRTTMNIYTTALPERLRKANLKVVRLLLPTGT